MTRPGEAGVGARVGDVLTTAGYLAGWRAVRMAPEPVARAAFGVVADRVYAANGPGVQRLRANLARAGVRGDADVAGAVHSYLRYWCESFRLPGWPREDLVARTRLIGEPMLRDALAQGGVVVALPHMANWDWAGAWALERVQQVMSVAERLRPERVFDRFVAYRESIGIHVIPLSGGADPMPQLSSWVREGGLACLVADRDLTRSGVVVDLLGEPARLPAGPAVLARRTKAALLPVTLWYDGPRLVIRVHDPVPHGPALGMTQAVADVFSDAIRAHPHDWHMMQRVFVADLEPGPTRGRGTHSPSEPGPA